ncbi:MAG: ATP-binding protein [Actinomycetota bacterium]|nr:ATP-binding protein [Actinomycetota bacterium]
MFLARTPATVSLKLESRPDSVACVRAVLSGAGESVGLGRELLDDLRTAVSEACNNVVLHAYGEKPGPLLVDVALNAGEIRVAVADRGVGLRSLTVGQERMRVGIPLISALADRAEFLSVEGKGTEVRMAFTGGGARAGPGPRSGANATKRGLRGDFAHESLSGDVVAFVSPSSLLSGVLSRVCSVIAVRAQFTVDRHSDLALVTDAVAAQVVETAPEGGVGFSVVVLERRLELTIGPLPTGSATHLRSAYGAGPGVAGHLLAPLQRLVDGLDIERARDGEMLSLLMLDRRPPAREPASGVSPPR